MNIEKFNRAQRLQRASTGAVRVFPASTKDGKSIENAAATNQAPRQMYVGNVDRTGSGPDIYRTNTKTSQAVGLSSQSMKLTPTETATYVDGFTPVETFQPGITSNSRLMGASMDLSGLVGTMNGKTHRQIQQEPTEMKEGFLPRAGARNTRMRGR